MTGWTENGLSRAWRALTCQKADEDWRFVHLTKIGDVSIEAGCKFPHAREALIIAFKGILPIKTERLPEGNGFDIIKMDEQDIFSGKTAIAIVRRLEGSEEIFTLIAVDLLRTLETSILTRQASLIEIFFERVREWQTFLAQSNRPLSDDAQIGLLGELWLLSCLSQTSLKTKAIDCWRGPLQAAQDFHISTGAIEVKSTLRTGAFLVKINSIEQLDGDRSPIFLCGLRFEQTLHGVSLVDLVSQLRDVFSRSGTRMTFEALLLVMGYKDEHSSNYERTFVLKEARAFLSDEKMPRLSRSNVPEAIRSASYVLDLDAFPLPSMNLTELLDEFGLS
jgi:hypothetical protein